MNGSDLKIWREAKGLTQAELGQRLGKSREAVVGYEKSDKPVPKTVELALLAVTLGGNSYNGREVVLNQFRLEYGTVRGSQKNEFIEVEQLNSLLFGRGKTTNRGDIAEWLDDREGIRRDANGLYVTDDENLAFEIKVKWF